ncbi:MAG TPA: hypothetical protein VKS98_12150 [Chthoniobacterales bacterium]|nr:hypothetical protein [Chthoniobacterales bacterium]
MKRILLLIAVLTVAFSGLSFAALGDTEDQVADLLGKPAESGFPDQRGVSTNVYQKGNYIVLVQFLHHLSLAESYTRMDKAELRESEITALLEGSGNDLKWIKNPDKPAWIREDHKARAWCETLSGRPTLLIQAQ